MMVGLFKLKKLWYIWCIIPHLGIQNCKKRARQALFWPLINKELEDMTSKCPTCLTYRNRQPSETFIKPEIPNHPWTKSAADLFRLQGYYCLLFVDYYSKFIAIENLQNPQSETVINKCKNIFSQFGIPKELITDNRPQFSSHKLRSFSKSWYIPHKTISPCYHQLNGLAERSIQTVKRTVNKAKLEMIENARWVFDKATYWRNDLYGFNNFCVLETIST